MKTRNQSVSETFSAGNFPACYPHFADDIRWNIIGATTLEGKEPVMAYCTKMREEMDGSTLNNTTHIEEGNLIAVQGYCDYATGTDTPGRVEYCDVYRFKDEKLQEITSYCIEIKKG